MNKDLPSIVGKVSFDYDDDNKKFGQGDRIVNITGQIDDEGTPVIILSFNLGRKEDNSVTLVIEADEFIKKFLMAMVYREDCSE